MKLASCTAALTALFFLGFGLLLFFFPRQLGLAQIQLDHPTALMEVRAFYGGMEIALGLVLLRFLRSGRIVECLELSAFLLLGILAGRAYGAIADGVEGWYLFAALSMELPLCILTLVCLQRQFRRQADRL